MSSRNINTPVASEFRRAGYSLLELMLAMSLLAGLLAVGWSLLGTYRDAEQRGWKLAARTNTVRIARQWIENDLAHLPLIPMRESGHSLGLVRIGEIETSPQQQPGQPRFIGNSVSFSAIIAPSIDPLPFLERLISGANEQSPAANSSLSIGRVGNNDSSGSQVLGLWPPRWLAIEYRLINADEDVDSRDQIDVWTLVRRETIDRTLWSSMQANDRNQPDEPELTLADLYNRSESNGLVPQPLLINEAQLSGISGARFTYYDGTQWISGWDSRTRGGYPRAVCLEFNLVDQVVPTGRRSIAEVNQEQPNEFDLITSALNTEDSAGDFEEIADDYSAPRDIRVVVHIRGHGAYVSSDPLQRPDLIGN
jgi:prepilin-type N-terminal cleavage/methylation domain-containing protein